MTRSSRTELRHKTLDARTTTERAGYDRVNAEARLAAEVGEHIHDAREAAGLSQRELSRRTGTSEGRVAPGEHADGLGPPPLLPVRRHAAEADGRAPVSYTHLEPTRPY